jgi:hypothetical protein
MLSNPKIVYRLQHKDLVVWHMDLNDGVRNICVVFYGRENSDEWVLMCNDGYVTVCEDIRGWMVPILTRWFELELEKQEIENMLKEADKKEV